jgi:hypothetical protein
MKHHLKQHIEQIVDTENNFNMARLAESAWPVIETQESIAEIVPVIRSILGNQYIKLAHSILRNTFLIELAKVPKIETTKFRLRWFNQLHNDPRFCSFEECLQIVNDLVTNLPMWLQNPVHLEALMLSLTYRMVPYEIPLDYQRRVTNTDRLHQRGNLIWFCDDLILRTLKLRKYLLEQKTSPDPSFFRRALTDKIKVKTYLTDCVLTGDYKTNREKRWETHPKSVHFAERRTCMAIEYALVTQICAFKGFPNDSVQQLRQAKILPIHLSTALCPITGDPLSYEAFRDELLNPTHGKSDFQVGHLNPLKHEVANGTAAGHTADNISWISSDGNRIQGSLSLYEVRALIKRIAENYKVHGW